MFRTRLNTPAMAAAALIALSACVPDDVVAPDGTSASEFAQISADNRSRHVFVLNEDVPSDELQDEIRSRGGEIERAFDTFGVITVRGLDDQDARMLLKHGDVADGGEDMTLKWVPGFDEVAVRTMELPSGEVEQSGAFYYAQGMQWSVDVIRAAEAWQGSEQGEGTVVAILDTGIDPFHIDTDGKVVATSASMLTPGSSPCGEIDEQTIFDLDFHGTFVAGQISSNGLGMASVAPNAQLMAVKVLNCSGSGSFADIMAGIAHAADAGADVINMSLGAYFSRSEEGARPLIRALRRAVRYAYNRGSLVVASSGNDGINLDRDGDYIHVPSQLNRVLSVGATAPIAQQDFDMLASYSNYGRTGNDMVAPGGDLTEEGICGFAPIYRCDLILSAFSSFIAPGPNYYVLAGGTSFASPLVAGAAAVVIADGGAGEPDDDDGWRRANRGFLRTLEKCILDGSADIGPRRMFGAGRLDVVGAVACGDAVYADDDDDDDDGADDDGAPDDADDGAPAAGDDDDEGEGVGN